MRRTEDFAAALADRRSVETEDQPRVERRPLGRTGVINANRPLGARSGRNCQHAAACQRLLRRLDRWSCRPAGGSGYLATGGEATVASRVCLARKAASTGLRWRSIEGVVAAGDDW